MSLSSCAPRSLTAANVTAKLPPHVFFVISAIFHYLGPAFAVLLFAHVPPLGVAWLRNAVAAAAIALWRRPWRQWRTMSAQVRRQVFMFGSVLALMNATFYLAIDRLPLSTVGAIEFLGPIALATVGMRTARNTCALVLAGLGVYVLTDFRFADEPLGFVFAFANCVLFVFYIVLGHRLAHDGGALGIDRLGLALLVAMIVAVPIGIGDAAVAFGDPRLLVAAAGVAISSSVIPYVCDQLALSRLSRGAFALLMSLLPATATLIGILMLQQMPSLIELVGIALVIVGVGTHRDIGS